MTELPIETVLPLLRRALAGSRAAVLEAPPGAGKTTRVPLALLEEPWLAGKRIVMLEPRRLAARSATRRMAEMLGEPVGATVGHRIRFESTVGRDTRIEVVTEGILTRRLHGDPSLEGVGLVIFDEFHERSLDADLALALCLEAQAALREDLRLLVMSATLDGGPIARLLGEAPVISSAGRAFPVETRYLDRTPGGRIEDAVVSAVQRGLEEETGDILAFLPGSGEIRRVARALEERRLPESVMVTPLYGELATEAQELAIRPAPPGRRKVVLATSIAETSLTIEGVRVVVDAGLMRVPKFDPRRGMTRLETLRVSQASADQRRGRAGRLGPGLCLRLWTEAEHGGLRPQSPPEILEADLAPLALDLALWGSSDPTSLAWLDPPPPAALAQARDLLHRLGAVDVQGRITSHGRELAALALPPRLAHMIVTAHGLGLGALACDVAALLAERDIVRARPGYRDCDLRLRVDLLHRPESGTPPGLTLDSGAAHQVRKASALWRRRLIRGPENSDPLRSIATQAHAAGAAARGRGLQSHESKTRGFGTKIATTATAEDTRSVGVLVALAYPDRVAQRRPGTPGGFRLAGGGGAVVAETDPLAAADWLAVADLDGERKDARVFLCAPLTAADIEQTFSEDLREIQFLRWDGREEAVRARRQIRFGELVLKDEPLRRPDPEAVAAALLDGIRVMGLDTLPWTPEAKQLRARLAFARRVRKDADAWPDVSDEALLAEMETWLAPHLGGMSRKAHLATLNLAEILAARLPWETRQALDSLAPTHVTVPTGSRLPLDYDTGGPEPVLAVRLQEMFGTTATPTVAGGRMPVLLHLLSPAGRPIQVTRDLATFWANGYQEAKGGLRGRYPRHHWPDDPLQATPTNRAKRHGR
ncbi:MAG: ATP-dependent helicase HrpB [Alphaproteobacteria bacterium]